MDYINLYIYDPKIIRKIFRYLLLLNIGNPKLGRKVNNTYITFVFFDKILFKCKRAGGYHSLYVTDFIKYIKKIAFIL